MTPTKLLGLLLVILYAVALKVVASFDLHSVFEPHFLLLLLNTLFHGIIPIGVAYAAGKSYLTGGSVTVLFMGCGMLAFGSCAISAGWLIDRPDGPNLTVTVHNTGVFLGSFFHAIGAVLSSIRSDHAHDARWRKPVIYISYSAVILFMICFSFAALKGLTPVFFVQGVGPTHLRQSILGSSVLLYFVSSAFLMLNYFKVKSGFLFWYSLCLILICMGLFGVFIQKAVGSPVGWVARSAMYVGGIYALAAVLSALRDARLKDVPLEQAIAVSSPVMESSLLRDALAAVPLPIIFILFVLIGSLDIRNVFDPPGLLAAMNTLFLSILPLVVFYVASKGYLQSGSLTMIMLGSATFTLGLGALLAGWVFSLEAGGPNANVTVFNLSALLSAIFHLLGALFAITGINPKKDTPHKALILAFVYSATTLLLILLAFSTMKGFIPTFFVQGQGPTMWRQTVITTAAAFFTISGGLFLVLYLFSKVKFLYWYSLALFLNAGGLTCLLVLKVVGSPIGWLGRSALYLSGLYLLMAVVSASRELGERGESLEIGIARFFRHHLESLVEKRTIELSHAKDQLQATQKDLEQANAEILGALEQRSTALQNAALHNDLLQKIRSTQAEFISGKSSEELFGN